MTTAIKSHTARRKNPQPDTGNRQLRFSNSFWFGPVLSGVLTFFAVCQIHFWPSWVCFLPFFLSVLRASPGRAFKKGTAFGATVGVPTFFWMVSGAERFTGGNTLYGMFAWLLSTAALALYFGGISYVLSALKEERKGQEELY